MTFVEEIRQRASELTRRIVFPEGGDERVLSAAREIARSGMANPLLLVDGERVATSVRSAGLPAIPFEGDSALEFGHRLLAKRGVGETLAAQIEDRTGFETRVTVLGHVQRGGSPTPRDRVLATRFGLKAAKLVDEGKFGRMAALHGDDVVDVSLKEATAELKLVPDDWYDVARAFFG